MKEHFSEVGFAKPSLFVSAVLSIPVFAIVLILGAQGIPQIAENFSRAGGSGSSAGLVLYSAGVSVFFFCSLRSIAYLRWWIRHSKDSSVWGRFEPLFYALPLISTAVLASGDFLQDWLRFSVAAFPVAAYLSGLVFIRGARSRGNPVD